MPSGPSRRTRSRAGAAAACSEPTSTACSASGAFTGTASAPAPSATHATTRRSASSGTSLSSGRHVEQLALAARGAGLEAGLLLEPRGERGRGRPVVAGQQQHPVGEPHVGGELAEVDAPEVLGRRRVVLEARGVPQPVVGRGDLGVLAEAVERLALAQEGPPGQARVPADQRGVRRGAGRLRGGERGAEPHPDRGDRRGAEVEEVLAGRLDAVQPRAHPVGLVLEPGGVAGAVVVEAQRDDPGLGERLGQPAEGAVRGAPLLPHRRAEDRAAAGHAAGGPREPAEEGSRLRPEPHLGVLGPVRRRAWGHASASDACTSAGQAETSVPWVAKSASVIRSSPKPMHALCAVLPSSRCRPKVWPKWSSW